MQHCLLHSNRWRNWGKDRKAKLLRAFSRPAGRSGEGRKEDRICSQPVGRGRKCSEDWAESSFTSEYISFYSFKHFLLLKLDFPQAWLSSPYPTVAQGPGGFLQWRLCYLLGLCLGKVQCISFTLTRHCTSDSRCMGFPHIEQVSSTSWVSSTWILFWYGVPGVSIRFHKLKA